MAWLLLDAAQVGGEVDRSLRGRGCGSQVQLIMVGTMFVALQCQSACRLPNLERQELKCALAL